MNTVLFLADGANTSAQFIETIYLIFCSSMNKPHSLSLIRTHSRQTTVNEHAYGTERIHSLGQLAKTELNNCMTLNPPSTLNNVGLVARPQHSPCSCCTHVLARYWRVGTTLVLQTLVDATVHRLIKSWVEQTERWLCGWYRQRILVPTGGH